MKPILIINLGGTICMSPSASGLVPDQSVLPRFLDEYHSKVEYEFEQPFELIDSSQASYKQWFEVASYIQSKINDHPEKYCGVLITHGTDTMAYFASALRFYFKMLSVPMIVTGSQIPLTQTNSDAIQNINFSLKSLQQDTIKKMGVALAFNNQLLMAEKVSKVDTLSLNGFTQNTHHEISLNTQLDLNCVLREFNEVDIQLIWIHPGLTKNTFPKVNTNTVYILKSYGSGTLPKSHYLIDFLESAQKHKASVINHSQCFYANVDMDIYEAGNWLKEFGVIGTKNMSLEALIAKIQCLDVNNSFEKELLTPLHYELA
ncbi:asparaginase domain-containing protein [Marinicellulosiphila megalodicopiae]|uniref:asparaginase domain-containing protein n=1 Tax=Marinicellulosiphila megalodicopiae TaxID=2724896 RepID=UPI003BB18854